MESLQLQHVSRPSELPADNATLCVAVTTDGDIVTGHESGAYISRIDTEVVQELKNVNAEVPSVLCSTMDKNKVFISSQCKIYQYDLRQSLDVPVITYSENSDEINCISLDASERLLASCDDTGDCCVIDVSANKVMRSLKKQHTNICSTSAFLPSYTGELITGGLDSRLLCWDVQRVKVLYSLNTQELLAELGDDSVYMFNPPFVYSLDVNLVGDRAVCGMANGFLQVFDIGRSSRKRLQPSLLLNKHSSLGVTCVHFSDCLTESALDQEVLLSSGNDGMVHLWCLEENQKTNQRKKESGNHLCSEEEIERMLSLSLNVESKVNFLTTAKLQDRNLIFVCDQTNDVKVYHLQI